MGLLIDSFLGNSGFDMNGSLVKMIRDTFLFLLRLFFFCFEYPLWLMDRLIYQIVTSIKKPEFKRMGQCEKTGQCCRAIGMGVPQSWLKYPRLIKVIQIWHRVRYNFVPIGTYHSMIVYECRFLTRDNQCSIHRFKPALCRDFPKLPLYGFTKLHKGCGYSFVRRDESEFEKVLKTCEK